MLSQVAVATPVVDAANDALTNPQLVLVLVPAAVVVVVVVVSRVYVRFNEAEAKTFDAIAVLKVSPEMVLAAAVSVGAADSA